MSPLSRFMTTATEILDEQDRKVRKEQPPFFTRTNWLFVELEELALPDETADFKAMKIARLGGDIAAIARIVDRIAATTEDMPSNRQRHERRQLCAWINEQIEREPKHGH